MKLRGPNHCVQATPDFACCEFMRQTPGAPDAEHSAD